MRNSGQLIVKARESFARPDKKGFNVVAVATPKGWVKVEGEYKPKPLPKVDTVAARLEERKKYRRG